MPVVRRALPIAAAFVVSMLAWGVAPAVAEDVETSTQRTRLSGDWFGARPWLESRGITIEAFYSLDVLANVAGGARRATSVLGDLDLLLHAELEPLVGWPGARLFLYGLGTHGDRPSRDAGDLQGVDNIEATDTWKVYEAWLEQDLFSKRVSLLAGLYDVNSEFDVLPSGSLFIHSSPGMGADFGLSGRNGPSTFPTTSLAARVQIEPRERVFARFVVADGVPGDPDDPHGTQVEFSDGDGVLLAGELGFYHVRSMEIRGRTRRQTDARPDAAPSSDASGSVAPVDGRSGKFAIGAWGYTSDFEDAVRVDGSGDPRERSGSWGVYALVEHGLSFEPQDPVQGLTAYLRVGLADPRTAPVDGYVGGGAVYHGLLPGRDEDRIGFSIAAAHLGSDFRKSSARAGRALDDWEIALEWTYRIRATPWLSIQPDVQYVIDPGGDTGQGDALVVGTRFIIEL